MTKVYLDSQALKSYVSPKLEDGVYKLQKAYEIAKYLSIPGDFRYYRYLSNLKYELENFKRITESVNSWIDKSITSYEQDRIKMIEECNKIESQAIEERMNIVK